MSQHMSSIKKIVMQQFVVIKKKSLCTCNSNCGHYTRNAHSLALFAGGKQICCSDLQAVLHIIFCMSVRMKELLDNLLLRFAQSWEICKRQIKKKC